MKHGYIILLLLVVLGACNPHNTGNVPDKALTDYDSVYVIADIQWHKQYYPLLDKQVFSIDLLSIEASRASSSFIPSLSTIPAILSEPKSRMSLSSRET